MNKTPAPVSSPEGLKLMITVVNRVKSEYFADYIQSFGVNAQFFVSAMGTAKSETLELLGLSDDRKSVIISVIRADTAEKALAGLAKKFETIKYGKGIAFTVPMTSVIGVAAYRFPADKRDGGSIL